MTVPGGDKARHALDRAREWQQRSLDVVDDLERRRAGRCRRCDAVAGTMRTLCNDCAQRRRIVRSDYRHAARDRRSAEITGVEHWLELHRWVAAQRFTLVEIAGDNNDYAAAWLSDLVRLMVQRGETGDAAIASFESAAVVLPLSTATVAALRIQLERARWFGALEFGEFPTVPTDVALAPGERCHLDVRATLVLRGGDGSDGGWSNARATRSEGARLLLTDRRIMLLTAAREHQIGLGQVVQVVGRVSAIAIQTTDYLLDQVLVDDPQWIVALTTAVVRASRGEPLRSRGLEPTAATPQVAPSQPFSVFTGARQALANVGREADAVVVDLVAGRWSALPPEQQVRAERAAEAIAGTFAVLDRLPQHVREQARGDGSSPATDAAASVDNAMVALSDIVVLDQRQYADQLAAMRNYTQQWRPADDPLRLD